MHISKVDLITTIICFGSFIAGLILMLLENGWAGAFILFGLGSILSPLMINKKTKE